MPLNKKMLKQAILEAERFILTATLAEARIDEDIKSFIERFGTHSRENTCTITSKETAACRRASMDLTRVLAKLRKP